MSILFGHDQAVAEWVGKKVGKPFSPPFVAFGALDGQGTLTAGAVFTNYQKDSIELSLAGRGVVQRQLWFAIINYVFDQLACSRLGIVTHERNKAVKRMAPKMGFKFEGKLRKQFGNADGYVYSLTDDDLPEFRKRWKL